MTNRELTTNNHKTGKIYNVHLYIQEDQREFLRAMKAKYLEEFKVEPFYVFASTVNKIETSTCRGLQDVFKNLFGDDPSKVRFNSNSIRKFWERLWSVIKGSVSDGVNKAHLAQTAHCEKTAQEKYLARNGTREERQQVLDIYAHRLMHRGDDEYKLPALLATEELADEEVESDIDEEDQNEAPQIITPLTLLPVTRFDLVRNSLQATNQPSMSCPPSSSHPPSRSDPPTSDPDLQQTSQPAAVRRKQTPRNSLDLMDDEEQTAMSQYLASLKNFRVRAGKPPWTEEQKGACLLFQQCRGTVSEGEVRKRIEEGGSDLTTQQIKRIY